MSRNNYSNFINDGGCCSETRKSIVSIRAEDFKYRFTIKRGRLTLLSPSRERFNFTEATAVLSMLLQLYQSNRIELNGRLRNNGVSIILYNTLLYSRDISYCSNAYRTQSCFSFFFRLILIYRSLEIYDYKLHDYKFRISSRKRNERLIFIESMNIIYMIMEACEPSWIFGRRPIDSLQFKFQFHGGNNDDDNASLNILEPGYRSN